MYMDSEKFENWMERIMERFDRTEKLLERVLKKSNALDGEEVLDKMCIRDSPRTTPQHFICQEPLWQVQTFLYTCLLYTSRCV